MRRSFPMGQRTTRSTSSGAEFERLRTSPDTGKFSDTIGRMEKPVPSAEGKMSTSAKMSLAEIAMQLRDEQLQARVIHYKGELETSPELDAVTAQVIAELQGLQAAARLKGGSPASRPPPADD